MASRAGRLKIGLASTSAVLGSTALVGTFAAFGFPPPESGSQVYGSGEIAGGITVEGSGDDNGLRVTYDGATNRFLVTDDAGVSVGAGGCESLGPNMVSCQPSQPDPYVLVPGVDAILRGGADRAVFAAAIPGTVFTEGGSGGDHLALEPGGVARGRLVGGGGADQITGGSGDDSPQGGPGPDMIAGGAGGDHLTGGPGKDTIVGGPGDDRLSAVARGRDRDLVIRCGKGDDVARVDRGVDPEPHGCEKIKQR